MRGKLKLRAKHVYLSRLFLFFAAYNLLMDIKVKNIKRKSTSRRNHWEINKSNDHRNIGTAGFQSLSPDVCKSSFIYIYIYIKQVKFELKFPIYQLIKRISKMSFLTSGMPYCGRNQKARFLLWIEQGSNSLIGHLKSLSEGDEQDEKKKVDDVHWSNNNIHWTYWKEDTLGGLTK